MINMPTKNFRNHQLFSPILKAFTFLIDDDLDQTEKTPFIAVPMDQELSLTYCSSTIKIIHKELIEESSDIDVRKSGSSLPAMYTCALNNRLQSLEFRTLQKFWSAFLLL
ncbi:hypothetical protein ACJX0J_016825, partial [Zea mays]